MFPEYKVPLNSTKLYLNGIKKVESLLFPTLQTIRNIGQCQLLRRQIANMLQFSSQLDAHLLHQALDTFNKALLADMQLQISKPTSSFPSNSPLLAETASLVEACGLDNPLEKIYMTSKPLDSLPVLLFLFLLAYLPKVLIYNITGLYEYYYNNAISNALFCL